MNLYIFLNSSGIWGYPLLFLSLISLAVIMDRTIWIIYMNAANRAPDFERLGYVLQNGEDLSSAWGKGFLRELLENSKGNMDPVDVEKIKIYAQEEWDRYFSCFSILNYVVTVAPLVGILGTITGIIKSFKALGELTSAGQSLLTGGISEALTTTAAGLLISVFTLTFSSLLRWRGNCFFKPYEKAITLIESSMRKRYPLS